MAVEGSLLYKALPWSTRDVLREDAYSRLSTLNNLVYNYGNEHQLRSVQLLGVSFPNAQLLWRGRLEPEKLHGLLTVSQVLDDQYSRLKKSSTRESLLKFREIAEPLAIDTYERMTSQTALKLRLLRQLKVIEENTDRWTLRRAARTEAERAFQDEIFNLVDSRELKLDSLSSFFNLGRRMVRQFELDSAVAAANLETSLAEAELHIELDFAVSDS